MQFFWRKKKRPPIDYSTLISDLQEGNFDIVRKHLAFSNSINYVDGVNFMLAKMRRPEGDVRNLSLFQTVPNGQFELAIFNVPWNSNLPHLPLILNLDTSEICGIMLPFNELHDKLSKRQKTEIAKLSMTWTGFAIESQFSI